MVPPSVASKPARQRSKVLFPEPFGPVTSIISPGSTVPETPCSTDSRPKWRRTWSNWSRGAFTRGNIQAESRKPPALAGGTWRALVGAGWLTLFFETPRLERSPRRKALITPALFSQPPPRLTGEEGEQQDSSSEREWWGKA